MAVWMVEDESRGCWLEADRSGICRRRCVGLLLVGYSGRLVCWWRREQLTNSGGCLCIQSRGGDREGRRAGEMKEGMDSVSSREDEERNGQRRNRLDFLEGEGCGYSLGKMGKRESGASFFRFVLGLKGRKNFGWREGRNGWMETEGGSLLFWSGVWLLGELEFGQVREEKKNERLVRRGAPLLPFASPG
uniref:Uncharacterized protein n=1 Tax=Populus alba TaxID=43335 RepID=A0A4V6A9B5_POPAL|nr:hypothetical protein D5086_0000130040 [Populus alba]